LPKALNFWKIAKEINPQEIRKAADEPFRVGGIGTAESLIALRRKVGIDEQGDPTASGRWVEATLPLTPEGRRALSGCVFALTLDEAPDSPVLTYRLTEDKKEMERDVAAIMDRFPALLVALPRHIPLFRDEATSRIIARFSRVNTEISLASAIPGVIPWTAPLLPATALPDMILLTKNQAMMSLRIAAVYGKEIDVRKRVAELSGVVGAAMGWRALARQVIGAVPGGVGVVAKGSIAYAGTVAAGRGAQKYYQYGRKPTEAEKRGWYRAALRQGREVARDAWQRIRRKQE
jgi:uncharacterized protein (DUF697 family)